MRYIQSLTTALLLGCAARNPAVKTPRPAPTVPAQPADAQGRECRECINPNYKPPGKLFMHISGKFDHGYRHYHGAVTYYDGYHLYLDEVQGFTICPLEFYHRRPDWGDPAHHDERNVNALSCFSLGKLRFYRKEKEEWHLLFEDQAGNRTACSPRLTCQLALGQDPESYARCVSFPKRCVPVEMSSWPKLEDWNSIPFELW